MTYENIPELKPHIDTILYGVRKMDEMDRAEIIRERTIIDYGKEMPTELTLNKDGTESRIHKNQLSEYRIVIESSANKQVLHVESYKKHFALQGFGFKMFKGFGENVRETDYLTFEILKQDPGYQIHVSHGFDTSTNGKTRYAEVEAGLKKALSIA